MRVIVAPDAFAGLLSARQAADAIAGGWTAQAPSDVLVRVPLSDAGPGLVDVVSAARGGQLIPCVVGGPLGDPVPATLLVVDEPDGGRTAYVESVQACGPHLLAGTEHGVRRATSAGVGELVRAAVDLGATRVVVGIGDSASHDGGAGVLHALGAGASERLVEGGGGLDGLAGDALAGLPAARERLAGVELVVATAADLPLLGFHGASATDAVRRGATPEQAQALEAALGRFAELAQRSLVAGRSLAGAGLAAAAGSGAGGGIGFALLLLGGRRVDGVEVVLAATRFAERLRGSDLLVTGERVFGWPSLRSGVVASTAAAALRVGVPTVVLACEVEVGRREALSVGVSAAYGVAGRAATAADAVRADPAGSLAAHAARVARTWSR